MKANELQINNFLQAPNVQFVIPVYQRNYDWTNYECKELLNDIISVETEDRGTHFIGSIVFVHEGTYSTSEVKELVIIDGQQRLTSIYIGLKGSYAHKEYRKWWKDDEDSIPTRYLYLDLNTEMPEDNEKKMIRKVYGLRLVKFYL